MARVRPCSKVAQEGNQGAGGFSKLGPHGFIGGFDRNRRQKRGVYHDLIFVRALSIGRREYAIRSDNGGIYGALRPPIALVAIPGKEARAFDTLGP